MIASPLIPQFHHLLGPLFRDAGLPDGVLQILNFSEEDVAQRVEQLVAHEDIRVGISIPGDEVLMIDDQFHWINRTRT
jgi:acyl-CoA reductase-like NAD-dependent aldehyde dehydrogenase